MGIPLNEGAGEAVSAARQVRILLVSSAPLVRVALKQLLSITGGIKVVGEAGAGADATATAARSNPDIILLDCQLKNGDFSDQLRGLYTVCPTVRTIILSDDETANAIFSAARAGAWGYLPREVTPDELIRAVRTVSRGRVAIGVAISREEFARIGALSRRPNGSAPALSPKESVILKAMAEGHTDEHIAHQIGISVPTVKTHVRSILKKTGARNRAAAIAVGFRSGILP